MVNLVSLGYIALLIILLIIGSKQAKGNRQKRAKTARTTVRSKIPVNKGSKPAKKLPSHLEKQERVITGQSGSIPKDEGRGKRKTALRLMEGDPVPEGYLGITCHYCAAVNLVKKNSPAKHNCYFCREPID